MMKNQHTANTSTKIQDLRSTQFLNRIKKSLYYPTNPVNNYLSLPVIESTAEFITKESGQQLEKLDVEVASRISNAICASPCALVLALLYIERLKNCNPQYLQQVAPSELFLISLMVASKYLHDDGSEDEVVDAAWAISGRLTLSRTIKLEMEFLKAVNWMVSVRQETFWERLRQLEKEVAYREVQKRNWCSYTELNCLMSYSQLITVARSVMLVCCISLTAYVICFLIMFGSTFVLQAITLCCIWFVRTWQIVNLNETNITLCSNIPPSPLIDARSCVFNDEHVMPACSLFGDYKNEDRIGVEIQNADEYVIGHADNTSNNSDVNWQWWLNSTMTWLAEYSSKNFTSQVTKFNDTGSIFSGAKFPFNSTQNERIRNTEDFVLHWQKRLYWILNRLKTHWIELNYSHHKILQSIHSIDFLVQSRRFDR
ncbi:PREDICTED: protein CNPPD1 [Dinoponera quadriceps]|uniref:Protein CNPPD1 n=1 Tax=Dinoponera quadriceps TaxID=609295 RepID=A0A6P3XDN1_DINQU|nr:PREDICTED: protein CNPPD1 [Dinoponera quadriceps]